MKKWVIMRLSDRGNSSLSCALAHLNNDVDAVFKKAIDAGAKVFGEMGVTDQFYGDRAGTVVDPFGHKWTIATHKEDVSFEEMQRRSNEMFKVN